VIPRSLSIYDLGLVHDIDIARAIAVKMTLTSACPSARTIRSR
jgi:metal-sulfur cluster biosynthetic enzyme